MKNLLVLFCIMLLGTSQVFASWGMKAGSKASNASIGYFIKNSLNESISYDAGLGYLFAPSGIGNIYIYGSIPVSVSGFNFDAKAGFDYFSGTAGSVSFFAGVGMDRLFNQKDLSLELGADLGSVSTLVLQIGYAF